MRRKTSVIVVIVGLLIAGLIVYASGLESKRDEIRDRILLQGKRLFSYRSLLDRSDEIKGELNELKTRFQSLSGGLFYAKSSSLLQSAVQKTLDDYLKDASLTVVSIRPLDIVEGESLLRIPVEMRLSGGISELGRFLKVIEESPYLLSIDELSIRVANVREPGILRIGITCSGYTLKEKQGGSRLKTLTNTDGQGGE